MFRQPRSPDQGIAVLMAAIALSLFTLVALYVSLTATTELRVSDNFESHVHARYAALSGLNHARELLRGLPFDDLLNGPDGRHSEVADYLAAARAQSFRNPIDWNTARFLDTESPAADLAGIPDDGLISTGAYGTESGVVLIPLTGVAITGARYFVKVADNNGETSELSRDPADSPFADGDGTILVRSMGVARTINERIGAAVRRNAVSVFEGRFRRASTFELDSPLVIQGNRVEPAAARVFEGVDFMIQGGAGFAIGATDVDLADAVSPAQDIVAQIAPDQVGRIAGAGGSPSAADVTSSVASDPDKALRLDKTFLWRFAAEAVPRFADNVQQGDQQWNGTAMPELGSYDPNLPPSAPGQKPAVTYVAGNLSVGGSVSGAGLLVVTGRLTVTGSFAFTGLILLIGSGELDARSVLRVTGGIYVAGISSGAGILSWGAARISIAGNSTLVMNREAVKMAVRLIPPAQTGFREVTSAMDP